MLELLEAVHTRLSTDPTLLTEVTAINISSTYKKRTPLLPSVIFDIGNKRQSPLSGVMSVILNLEVRSETSKDDVWDIYSIVKGLLHNKPIETSSVTCLIHFIEEVEVNDRAYDQIPNGWVISAQYSIIFSNAGVLVTSGAVGSIYADATYVHVHSDHLIADFAGEISVYLDNEYLSHDGLYRFKDGSQFYKANGNIYVTNVQFKFASLNQLWSITYSASDLLNDGVTVSTSYLVKQSSYPKDLQLLFHGTKTDDNKPFEIYAPKAVLPVITIPFKRKEITLLDYRFVLLADANEAIVKLSVGN